jgi:hypothetical protein
MATRREFVQAFPAVGTAFAVGGHLVLDDSPARAQGAAAPLAGHFHPKGKAPSKFTLDVFEPHALGLATVEHQGIPCQQTRPDPHHQSRDSVPLYVEMMGGTEKIIARGQQLYDGERRVVQLHDEFLAVVRRSDLELTMMGSKTLEAQIADGTAEVQGDASILKQLASTMVDFNPRFEIMPGTKAAGVVAKEDPYEADVRQPIAE